jgi:tetratricopeptide (TPR) repeat protein
LTIADDRGRARHGAEKKGGDRLNQAAIGTVAEGREHEAVANARQRLEVQRKAVGERHPDYATALNQLALLLIMHGDPDRAEPLLRESLVIRKDVLGERHPDYATNLSSLAGLLWARGDLDGAEPLLRRALEVRWDVLGSSHPKSIASLNSLEQLLRAKQDWAGIERLSSQTAAGGPLTPVAEAATAVAPEPAPEPSASAAPRVEPAPATPEAEPASAAPEALLTAAPGPAPADRPVAVAEATTAVDSRPAPEPAAAVAARPSSSARLAAESEAASAERAELLARHAALVEQFAQVGTELAQQAEQWKSGGSPPSASLIEALSACHRDFGRLRDDTEALAGVLDILVERDRLANLEEIAALLQTLGEAEGRRAQFEAVRSQALAVLDRVLALSHADQKEHAPLAATQAKAGERRKAIAEAPVLELPGDATRLAEGEHPFNALLTLVAGEALSDDLWASSLEAVETEFGKPLSVAVARSKIVAPAGG